ncbi:MAG: pilus assembly protein [Kiritimatiellae bacterium]|nr:pilus assembly protein [Kiritimatiellia bacterium]
MANSRSKKGQAAVETVLAVLLVSFVFVVLFQLSRALTGKIMLEHAAMRVARARAVGFNDFMCLKSARVAVIPVAGERLWPDEKDFGEARELARIRTYMESPDEARARGLLEYEGWRRMTVDAGDGGMSFVRMTGEWFPLTGGSFSLEGKAGIEDGCSYYLE